VTEFPKTPASHSEPHRIEGDTFVVSTWPDGRRNIYCLLCDRCSYNPNDVENLYCGFCHRYHEIMKSGL
jgi:hypothetical protein